MKRKLLAVVALTAVMVVPVSAQDTATKKKRRGGRNVGGQLLKAFASAELTDEQTSKAKELAKAAAADMKKIREAAGITAELTKKRAEAVKSFKDSDKKGKELAAAINEKAGYSKEQAAALVKVNQRRSKFQKEVIALLTDEQKENLSDRLKRLTKERKGKGKRKKKDAA